jgi:hypothetical protein
MLEKAKKISAKAFYYQIQEIVKGNGFMIYNLEKLYLDIINSDLFLHVQKAYVADEDVQNAYRNFVFMNRQAIEKKGNEVLI